MLAACQVQWVSPYSADLQKKATDMLAEVVAWESHMRAAAGTAAADPRNPDVQATLEKWHGEIEAMSEIELGIDPGSTVCDKFVATISGSISGGLKKLLPDTPAAGSSAATPISHCETLPGIFTRMIQQVTGSTPMLRAYHLYLTSSANCLGYRTNISQLFRRDARLREHRLPQGRLQPRPKREVRARIRRPPLQRGAAACFNPQAELLTEIWLIRLLLTWTQSFIAKAGKRRRAPSSVREGIACQ
jgi:hypothetical protein